MKDKSRRREFLKISGLSGLGILAPGGLTILAESCVSNESNQDKENASRNLEEKDTSLIGLYGPWAASLIDGKLPELSFRRSEFNNVDDWRKKAREKMADRLAIPQIGTHPKVTVNKRYEYDGLIIEEVSWQLPYGRPTEAITLKPKSVKGKLPGILAFHDHGGNKYFGNRKITKTSDQSHPMMQDYQRDYYGGFAWANEIAKRGYVVLVPDAFTFGSRRVLLADVPAHLRKGLNDDEPEKPKNIDAYNEWSWDHEHIMAKSLFSAGTTWPGVFLAEDQRALDVLCDHEDVDASRVGCAGLSGGGMRTVFMGGMDERIKCAVCVGFMTTWKDFVLDKSFTHTWMTYVPVSPKELDFPEILGMRVPLPTLVLNDTHDDLYTLSEMERADKIMSEVYAKAKASANYKCSFHPGPHKFDAPMQKEAFDWFDQWLK